MKTQNVWTTFAGAVSVITDAAIMDALFVSFSWLESGQYESPGLPLWCLCALVSYAVNRLLLRKARPVPLLTGVNVCLLALTLCAIFLGSAHLGGWTSIAFTVFFLIVSLTRAFLTALSPVKLSAQLVHFDLMLFTLVWLALSCEALLPTLPGYTALLLAVLLLNLLSSVALRVGERNDGQVLVSSPVAGCALTVGLLAVLGGAVALIVFAFADSSRSAVDSLASGITHGFQAGWAALDAFLQWLFSLLPQPGPMDVAAPPIASSEPLPESTMEEIVLDPRLFWIIGGVIAAVILVVLLVLLFRFRRAKIELGQLGGEQALPARRHRVSGALARWLRALTASLRFRLLALRKRNTPPGALLWLEWRMKKAGAPRLPGETPRAFLLRISPQLEELADALDQQYYAGAPGTLTPAQCRRLRRIPLQLSPAPQPADPDAGCEGTKQDPHSPCTG